VVEAMPWTEPFVLVPDLRLISLHPPAIQKNSADALCDYHFEQVLDRAREKNVFPKLGKKTDEKFAILGAPVPIGIERTASSLFGIVGLGVHMNVYTRGSDGEIKMWIAKRSPHKSTYPGMLDNAVAGGVALGEKPLECLVREAAEEARLEQEFVREYAKAAGAVSWWGISDARSGQMEGLMNPGVVHVYDLEVGPGVDFKPVDGDVEGFALVGLAEVLDRVKNGEFKPISALVVIDFLVRWGMLTPENEESYAEVVARLHRKLPFPTGGKF
jgi:8-oxo-dGTP pyrophosphatase MutT (NUDIX family)